MILPNFSQLKVLIVGDVMLDRYWHGGTSRISPEAPVPVVSVNQMEEKAGGAGNVALNVASLGGQASLFSLTGDDDIANLLVRLLEEEKVECVFERLKTAPTITKLRVISKHQQLIRLDIENRFPKDASHLLSQSFKEHLDAAQVVILSDYAKGTLDKPQAFIEAAKQKNIPVLVDPKGDDFSIYRGATIITPNLKEFEAIVGQCISEEQLYERAQNLMRNLQLSALLVTRGEDGMTLFQHDVLPLHMPTQAKEVYDVTGAGDTVIASFALGLGTGMPYADVMRLANTAAGITVSKLGAATVTPEELRLALNNICVTEHQGMVGEHDLAYLVQEAQKRGERVVMTNGCFDILHAGHIAYLNEARALGDRLIVAVNTDVSVKRLKGAERPFNSLTERMAVLSGLRAVDWVVSFDDDTPKRLIEAVKPDILVKGGDYKISEIAGADFVLSRGGQVKSLSFVDGLSTSNLVRAIQSAREEEFKK